MSILKKRSKNQRFPCKCCGYLTISEYGLYDICPVCFWEDDSAESDSENEDFISQANNDMTLIEAKNNFRKFGACSEKFVKLVRKPTEDEIPK